MLAGGRLSHSDQSASLIYEAADSRHDLLILPVVSSAPRSVSVAGIDDDLNVWVDSLSELVEVNKFHIDRHTA